MRPELERLRLIEQQLMRGPAALPAEDWQLRLLLDGELAADTAAQQQLYKGLRLAGRRQLRRELAGIHTRLYGPPASPWARLWQRMKPW
ncbi:hypothetical protein ACFST9_11030 [Hymenobacter monticola]|uniref:Uncharacterized protein n=1 Tax=Hymenobacter monticola TaxID=1705399 RepID=A0ABY4BF40_9BACT|nr:hypothetical protein [Hymenobacter monticola]UOE35275.1 hypothetical protein MTP16_06380 [Hymenobacter monticola]